MVVALRTFRALEVAERAGFELELELLFELVEVVALEVWLDALCLRLAAANAFRSSMDKFDQMLLGTELERNWRSAMGQAG